MSPYLPNELWTQILFQANGESVRAASCTSRQLADVGKYVARNRRAEQLEERLEELAETWEALLEGVEELPLHLSSMREEDVAGYKSSVAELEKIASEIRSEWPEQELARPYRGRLARCEPENEARRIKAVAAGDMVEAAKSLYGPLESAALLNSAESVMDGWYDACLTMSARTASNTLDVPAISMMLDAADSLKELDAGIREKLGHFSWGFDPNQKSITERGKEERMETSEKVIDGYLEEVTVGFNEILERMQEIDEAFKLEYF